MTYKHIELDHLAAALPNLDCFVTSEQADEAANELGHISSGAHWLARYAEFKTDAMRARLAGNIKQALKREKNAEEVYKQLPDWAKW